MEKLQKKLLQNIKKQKKQYIKEMASEYYSRGEITEKVYNALMCYKVQMYDKYCLENLI